MAVRIIGIKPKPAIAQTDKVSAHLSIEKFKWINEQSLKSGITSRDLMFDWIVNKQGKAYIVSTDNKRIFVYGAKNPSGQDYIRSIEEGKWTDKLLELEEFQE